jgi:hypothetical protein
MTVGFAIAAVAALATLAPDVAIPAAPPAVAAPAPPAVVAAATAAAPAPLVSWPEPPPTPSPRALAGPLAGTLTLLAPLIAGGLLFAQDDHHDRERAGVYVMAAGMAAAPIVAHGVNGRWRRSLAWGALSLSLAAAAAGSMSVVDPFDANRNNRSRIPFNIFLMGAFFTSSAGVADSFIAGPAQPDRP